MNDTELAKWLRDEAVHMRVAGLGNRDRAKMIDLAAARIEATAGLVEAAEQVLPLLRLLTVRQVIDGGDEAIAAASLNPRCMNEGIATGDERISPWRLEAAIAKAKGTP